MNKPYKKRKKFLSCAEVLPIINRVFNEDEGGYALRENRIKAGNQIVEYLKYNDLKDVFKLADLREEFYDRKHLFYPDEPAIYTEEYASDFYLYMFDMACIPESSKDVIYQWWLFNFRELDSYEEKIKYVYKGLVWDYNDIRLQKDHSLIDEAEAEFEVLRNKYLTYKAVPDLYKRAVMKVSSSEDYSAFLEFLGKCETPKIICKPQPSDAFTMQILEVESGKEQEVFDAIITLINEKSEASAVVEEALKEAPIMKEASNHTAYTKIYTFRKEDTVTTFQTFTVKELLEDGEVPPSNGLTPTFVYGIDVNDQGNGYVSGETPVNELVKKAFTREDPIDKETFNLEGLGEVIENCKEAAKIFEFSEFLCFDLMLTRDRGWCLLEINGAPGFYYVLQSIKNKPMREEVQTWVGHDLPPMIDWKK